MPASLATSRSMTASALVALTAANFDATVRRPGLVAIDCSAAWCPPCRVFAPVFAAAAARRPELTWATLDTDDQPELAATLDVRVQPTLVLVRDGAVVYRQPGAMSASALGKIIARFAP
jgi:thioredoxin